MPPAETIDTTDDSLFEDLTELSAEELLETAKRERVQKTKITESYKDVERQRNQMESTMKNLKSSLEQSGKARMSIVDDKVRVEFTDNTPAPVAPKDDMSQVDDQIAELERLKDADDIAYDEYYKKIAKLEGRKTYLEEKRKDDAKTAQNREANTQTEYNEHWATKVRAEFGEEAWRQGSPLMNEMNALFEKTTTGMSKEAKNQALDKMKTDVGQYYQLAQNAKMSLEIKKTSRPNPADEFSTLSHEGSGVPGGFNTQSAPASIMSTEDKAFVEVNLGASAAKRLEKILGSNQKMGNLRDNDPYFQNSIIMMES